MIEPVIIFSPQGPTLEVEEHTFRMFDKVKVTISLDASNIQNQRIRMALIEPVVCFCFLDLFLIVRYCNHIILTGRSQLQLFLYKNF